MLIQTHGATKQDMKVTFRMLKMTPRMPTQRAGTSLSSCCLCTQWYSDMHPPPQDSRSVLGKIRDCHPELREREVDGRKAFIQACPCYKDAGGLV